MVLTRGSQVIAVRGARGWSPFKGPRHAHVWQLGPQQGLSAGVPSGGPSVWPGLPYGMAAGHRNKNQVEAMLPLVKGSKTYAALLVPHSVS